MLKSQAPTFNTAPCWAEMTKTLPGWAEPTAHLCGGSSRHRSWSPILTTGLQGREIGMATLGPATLSHEQGLTCKQKRARESKLLRVDKQGELPQLGRLQPGFGGRKSGGRGKSTAWKPGQHARTSSSGRGGAIQDLGSPLT